jgi:hypothetical protein
MQVVQVNADSLARAIQANDVSSDLLLGVVAGVVASVLVWVMTKAWKHLLEPWFEARVYKGLDVAGVWELDNKPGDDNKKPFDDDEVLSISQAAQRLSGTLTLVAPGAPAQTRVQEMTGTIRDRLVCFTTQVRDRKSVGYTCVLAEMSTDGQKMAGHAVYYDRSTSQVSSQAVVYTRKS